MSASKIAATTPATIPTQGTRKIKMTVRTNRATNAAIMALRFPAPRTPNAGSKCAGTCGAEALLSWVPPHFRQFEMGARRPFFLRGQIDGSLRKGAHAVSRGLLARRAQRARSRGPRARALRPRTDDDLRRPSAGRRPRAL